MCLMAWTETWSSTANTRCGDQALISGQARNMWPKWFGVRSPLPGLLFCFVRQIAADQIAVGVETLVNSTDCHADEMAWMEE